MHTFARLDIAAWAAPHDVQPLEVHVGDERVRGVVYNVSRRRLHFAETPTPGWRSSKAGPTLLNHGKSVRSTKVLP
jgi:hypothetical protein